MTDAAEWDDVPPPGTERDRWNYLPRYVGPNWERFEATAEALKNGRLGISWSWPAFLVTGLWLAYRRRFAWCALFISFQSVVGIAFGEDVLGFGSGEDAAEYVLLAAGIVLGCFGKALYLRAALGRIDHILATVPDEAGRVKQTNLAGGVDSSAVIVVILLQVILGGAELWYVSQYFFAAFPR